MNRKGRLARRLLSREDGLAALEFAALAPILLTLVFTVVIYSIYFTAVLGARQAAAEGARASVAALSGTERASLARTRAQAVIANYGSLLGGSAPTITTSTPATGAFAVTVTYDMRSSPIMRYGSFVPLPSPDVTATVTVTNGSY